MQGRVEIITGKLTRTTSRSVGWDIYSSDNTIILPGEIAQIHTDLRVRMLDCYGLIYSRSGLSSRGITTRGGVIDSDYLDEWRVILVNESASPYQICKGDRIAQVIFYPVFEIPVYGADTKLVERIGGFGSTG